MVNIIIGVQYRLLNLESGTYFTLSSDNISVVGDAYSGGSNQLWVFESSGTSGVYYMKSVETGAYIGVLGESNIVKNQQLMGIPAEFGWKVVNQSDMNAGVKFAVSINTSLYIDLYNGNTNNGTVVQLYPSSGNNQIWVLVQENAA